MCPWLWFYPKPTKHTNLCQLLNPTSWFYWTLKASVQWNIIFIIGKWIINESKEKEISNGIQGGYKAICPTTAKTAPVKAAKVAAEHLSGMYRATNGVKSFATFGAMLYSTLATAMVPLMLTP